MDRRNRSGDVGCGGGAVRLTEMMISVKIQSCGADDVCMLARAGCQDPGDVVYCLVCDTKCFKAILLLLCF